MYVQGAASVRKVSSKVTSMTHAGIHLQQRAAAAHAGPPEGDASVLASHWPSSQDLLCFVKPPGKHHTQRWSTSWSTSAIFNAAAYKIPAAKELADAARQTAREQAHLLRLRRQATCLMFNASADCHGVWHAGNYAPFYLAQVGPVHAAPGHLHCATRLNVLSVAALQCLCSVFLRI